MNKPLPSREQALELLKNYHCSASVIAHCKAVSKFAVQTAEQCQKRGLNVNVALVEVGALLHDIGRSKSHTVDHVVVGAQIARENGLPDAIVAIIERHVGGGITDEEAKQLGWPPSNYMPVTLEEKIVSYADKLVETSNRTIPIEVTVKRFREQKLNDAADRMLKIHNEISKLVTP